MAQRTFYGREDQDERGNLSNMSCPVDPGIAGRNLHSKSSVRQEARRQHHSDSSAPDIQFDNGVELR